MGTPWACPLSTPTLPGPGLPSWHLPPRSPPLALGAHLQERRSGERGALGGARWVWAPEGDGPCPVASVPLRLPHRLHPLLPPPGRVPGRK